MRQHSYLFVALMATVATTSCIDNSYDLDDVDMTIGISTDLTLPACSTGDVELRNIMDLEDDGVVQEVEIDGQSFFVVKQSGNANVKPIKIEEIRIKRPDIESFQSKIDLRNLQSNAPKRIKVNLGMGFGEKEIPDATYCYDLTDTDAKMQLHDVTTSNISTDIVSLERISFSEVEIGVNISVDNLPSYITKVHLDDLSMSLPKELNVTACTLNGKEAIAINPGKIQLTAAEGSDGYLTLPLTLKLVVNAAETGNNFAFDAQRHEVKLSGEFKIDGTFRLETEEMDSEQMVTIIEKTIAEWTKEDPSKVANFAQNPNLKDIDGLIPLFLNVHGNSSFNKDIVIQKVTGDFKHEINDPEPITLNDLPNFLNDDEVVLDLANPMVFLSIENSLPANIQTKVTFTSDTNPTPHSTNTLTLQGNKLNKYYLANKPENKYLPKEHKNAEYHQVANLGDLIKKVPKKINVDIDEVTLHAEDLDITQEYPISVNYDVFAPLAFGSDFRLVYQDSERDFDIDDVEDLDFEGLTLTAKATSTLPAEMSLTLKPLDIEGREITILETISTTIPAFAKDHAITLSVKPKAGYTMNDVLNGNKQKGVGKLDGVTYRAVIEKPTSQEPIPASAYLKLNDILLTLKGQITYDAN